MRSLLLYSAVVVAAVMAGLPAAPATAAPPFQHVSPEPTSSVYLPLIYQKRRLLTNTYQNFVRRRKEDGERRMAQQLQIDQLQRQQQALQSRLPPPRLVPPPIKRGVSPNIRSTGHETRFLDGRRFGDHLHYYAQPIR